MPILAVRRRSWWPSAFEVGVLVFGLAVILGVGFVTSHSSSTFKRDLPQSAALDDVQLHLLESYLGLKELQAGDRAADSKYIFGHIDAAETVCRTLLTGGPSEAGPLTALRGTERRVAVGDLCAGIAAFRAATTIELLRRAPAGQSDEANAFDKTYDASLDVLLKQAEGQLATIDSDVVSDGRLLDRLGRGLTAFLSVLFLLLALLMGRSRRVVERKSAELARMGALVESSVDVIASTALDGTLTSWNPAAERLFGYSAAEMVGATPVILMPEARQVGEWEIFGRATRGEPVDSFETVWHRKDGTQVDVAMAISPIRDADVLVGTSAIIRDISERLVHEAELAEAHAAALAAVKAKSEFLATMSHEIRTPMNGVIGLTGLLLQTPLDDVQQRYAAGVRGAGEALLAIIDDILDFSKLEAGKVEIERIDFDPQQLIEEVGVLLAATVHGKGLELLAYSDGNVPRLVCGDAGRIRQVLINLASNAVKFTASGEVVITAKVANTDGDQVDLQFSVQDSGIGMSATEQERLFKPFMQVDASTTRKYGGTGLGLAICRRLVEAMDGCLSIDSQPGAGSTFTFTVPLQARADLDPIENRSDLLAGTKVLVVDDNDTHRWMLSTQLTAWGMHPSEASDAQSALMLAREGAAGGNPYSLALLDLCMQDVDGLTLAAEIADDPALASIQTVILTSAGPIDEVRAARGGVRKWLDKPVRFSELSDALVRLVAPQAGAAPFPTPRTGEPAGALDGRILVVEDNSVNQMVADGVLRKIGYDVTIVANGLEALEALSQRSYDLVLMDCHMPEMDGYEATMELRRREIGGRRTPVIAMTAGVMAQDVQRCTDAGMDGFVGKPINIGLLQQTLSKWVPSAPAVAPPRSNRPINA